MAEVEEPLFGGLEAHRVVRVGATVRRPGGPWSPAVQALLRHLQAKGFPAPEPFGLDQRGREIVSFIDGTAGNWPWGEALRRTSGARQIGALLKDYHHAVQDFAPPAQAIWRDGAGSPGPGEIVLHGDFGPYNLIWRND